MPKKCPVPEGVTVGGIYKIKGHSGTVKYKVVGVRSGPREILVSFEPLDENGEAGEISLSMFKYLAESAWENDEESGKLLASLEKRMKDMGWPNSVRCKLWQMQVEALAFGFIYTDVDPFSREFDSMPVSEGEEDGS